MAKTSKKTRITEEEFQKIKAMIDLDIPESKIAQIVNRSSSLINYISRSDTLNDYHLLTRKIYQKHLNKKGKLTRAEKPESNEVHKYDSRFEQKIINRLDTIISILTKWEMKTTGTATWISSS